MKKQNKKETWRYVIGLWIALLGLWIGGKELLDFFRYATTKQTK